ncbi:MAG TPA: caspase family protein [Roseiarcus sp.]|nr:caspase family protein [Roseiarcus sp.]
MTRPTSLVLSLVALIAAAVATPALADKRIALVIGNSDYRSAPRLQNPTNDAKLIAKTLRGLGFTLIGGDAELNLDKAHFDSALQDFSNQVLGADVALFYYAGHGVQVAGRNFLIPIEANPTKESDVYLQAVDTAIVLSQMEGSGTKLNIVLLDACRDNPFSGRGLRAIGGGLAQMQAPEGTLISFATQPGAAALDGSDGDSPYSAALAATMVRPGLGLFDTFNEVGVTVKRATGGHQQPWVSSSPIEGAFYFSGAPQVVAAATPTTPAPATTDAPPQSAPAPRVASSASAGEQALPSSTSAAEQPAAPAPQPAVRQQQTAALTPQSTPPVAAGAEAAVAGCDRLAASPFDPTKPPDIPGVEPEALDGPAALSACRAAFAVAPDNPRIEFELGRADMRVGGADGEALALFHRAADAGHAAAMNNLGLAYERGIGVGKDIGEAARWFHRAAEAGNTPAMNRLGFAFRRGDGVPINFVQSLRWFRRSAEAGNPQAGTEVAISYQNGWGTLKDPAAAITWFRKAADAGNAGAMNHLGHAYLGGIGVARDPVEAMNWFRKAADAGNVFAMNSLGVAYRNGIGVAKDEAAAERWFAKARQ